MWEGECVVIISYVVTICNHLIYWHNRHCDGPPVGITRDIKRFQSIVAHFRLVELQLSEFTFRTWSAGLWRRWSAYSATSCGSGWFSSPSTLSFAFGARCRADHVPLPFNSSSFPLRLVCVCACVHACLSVCLWVYGSCVSMYCPCVC